MLSKFIGLTSLGCLLSSCATATWVAPDAGSLPASLKVQMDVPSHDMSKYLRPDFPTDSVGMRDWSKPSIAKGLIKAARLDSIHWVDTLSVVQDSELIDGDKYLINKPVSCSDDSWVLTISRSNYYDQGSSSSLPALFVVGNYALFNCAKQKILAKGRVYSRTPFFNLKKSDWETGFTDFGAEIGKYLPRRK